MAQGSSSFIVRPTTAEAAPNRGARRRRATIRGDAIVGFLLLKDLFRRNVGVNSLAGMVFATAVMGRELHRITAPLRKARPKRPSFVDTMIAAAVVREAAYGIAGERIRRTPFAGRLIAFALLRPAIRRIEAMPAALGHMVRAAFRGVRAALPT